MADIERMLTAYCWADTIDDVIATCLGVDEADVREVRLDRLRRGRVAALASELAEIVDWTGPLVHLVEQVMESAVERARRRQKAREASVASAPKESQQRGSEGQPDARIVDRGRSADRVMSRRPVSAESSAGVSGDRDPRRQLPRGAAGAVVGRRVGVDSAAETRDG